MRPTILALAASSCLASAHLAKWGGYQGSVVEPTEPAGSNHDAANGWTPKPTDAPGNPSPGAVLDLFKRRSLWKRQATNNTWLNDKTCGWFPGTLSAPLTCDSGSSCTTDISNIVGCAAGTSMPFWQACYDYNAFQRGVCDDVGPQTGCCQSSQYGACATFLWPGEHPASMFRCMEKPTVIMMRTEPVLVTTTTSTSTSTSTYTPTVTETAMETNTAWTTSWETVVESSTQVTLTSRDIGDGSNGRERIGVIIGAVLGSVVGLICIFFVIIIIVLRRDPQWRANMGKSRVKATPTPAPPYAVEDPERAGQESPQGAFRMETVKGKGGDPSV
ncbi:hypothetical protein B0T16DRAFT_455343 [Cercophora newfieldiana]|uniref:Mid2 domain-containing protein n=1 Tax=Cercophora newfieldiana TaxID=92897 RepID=A0AA40CWA8_9PEZI|nr:hypothetical protein B0T16DRAFT_455343 [Cercophora newfieldiana]